MGRYVICQVEVICYFAVMHLVGEDANQAMYPRAAKWPDNWLAREGGSTSF